MRSDMRPRLNKERPNNCSWDSAAPIFDEFEAQGRTQCRALWPPQQR